MDSAIQDAIAALNEGIRILLQVADTPLGAERKELIDSVGAELDEVAEILRRLPKLPKAGE